MELFFIKDLFLRSTPNPFQANETLTLLYNNSTGNGALPIIFRAGSIHHMGAMVLWIQDFSLNLFRSMARYYETKANDQMLVFILDRSCRKLVFELLLLVKAYHQQLKNFTNLNSTLGMYKNLLEEFLINANQSYSDSLLRFLGLIRSNSMPPEIFESERTLLCHGKLDSVFTDLLASLKPYFENTSKTLFPSGISKSDSMFKPPISHVGSRLDSILKTNIQKDSQLSMCSKCRQATQVSIPMDSSIEAFQQFPSWRNSYQDKCFCTGTWVLV